MLAAHVADGGRIWFREGKMTHRAESCRPERLHKAVGVRPPVESQAETVGGKHAVHLSECGFQPGVIVVVAYLATVAWFVGNKVRRIGENKIEALVGQCRKGCYAIGMDDG